MPAIVQLDLSQVLMSADQFICRWIELPCLVRTIAAVENLLRGQLQGGSLQFLRAGGIVIDTACLIGDLNEVVGPVLRFVAHRPTQEALWHNKWCGHCGVLKPRVVYFKYMWDQPAHRSVCFHCETHLKCYTCHDHCCIKRPSAFSRRQAR